MAGCKIKNYKIQHWVVSAYKKQKILQRKLLEPTKRSHSYVAKAVGVRSAKEQLFTREIYPMLNYTMIGLRD